MNASVILYCYVTVHRTTMQLSDNQGVIFLKHTFCFFQLCISSLDFPVLFVVNFSSGLIVNYYYYTCIYNVHTFSSGTESEALDIDITISHTAVGFSGFLPVQLCIATEQVFSSPCVCVSVCLSVHKMTHKHDDGCQSNLVGIIIIIIIIKEQIKVT